MRECICGKTIHRHAEKGHREREYCSDKCRKRAWRVREKAKKLASLLDLEQPKRDYEESFYRAMIQAVHRETWQEDIQR